MIDLRGKKRKSGIDNGEHWKGISAFTIFLVSELLKSVVYQSKLGDYKFTVTST